MSTERIELEAIYKSAHVGLCLLRIDTRYIRLNERFAEINGFSIEEHIGRTVRELAADLADVAEDLARRVAETGKPVLNIEIARETPAQPGIKRYWRESWLPLKDDQGQVTAINIVAEEITEYKRTQEALSHSEETLNSIIENSVDAAYRRDLLTDRFDYVSPAVQNITGFSADEISEARFRSLLDNSMDVIYRLNFQTGRYDYISPSCEKVVGFSHEELMALDHKASLEMVHPEDRLSMRTAIERLEETGVAEIGYRQRAKDGSY